MLPNIVKMKTAYITSIVIALLGLCSQAQAADPQPKDPMAWNKIEVFKINKEEPSAFFIAYPNFESAAKPISTTMLPRPPHSAKLPSARK